MVSSDFIFKTNARLLEIFMCSTAVRFAGLTVVLVVDVLQLPPVMVSQYMSLLMTVTH